jgi:hypothetical protein
VFNQSPTLSRSSRSFIDHRCGEMLRNGAGINLIGNDAEVLLSVPDGIQPRAHVYSWEFPVDALAKHYAQLAERFRRLG